MAVPNPIIGTLFINGGTKGWSEKYFLNDTTLAAAKATMNQLCLWRASIMPRDFKMVWARVAFMDKLRNSKAVLAAPLSPNDDGTPAADTAGYGPVNITEDALLFRFETAAGEFATRHVRGIPDQQMTDDELANALTIPATPPAAIPAGITANWIVNLGSFLSYLKNSTVQGKILTRNPLSVELTPWESVLFRRSAIRRTGRPFDTSHGRRSVA